MLTALQVKLIYSGEGKKILNIPTFFDVNCQRKLEDFFQTLVALYKVYDFINLRYFSIFKFVKVKDAILHNFLWWLKSNKRTFCPRCDGICRMGCSIIFGRKNNLSECLIVKSFIDWYVFTQPPAEKRKKINAFQTSI